MLKDINSDPLRVLAYALGCFVGSYIGCYIEEKIAIGDNMITCITESNSKITNKGSIKINNVAEGIGIYGASGSDIGFATINKFIFDLII